MNENIRSDPKFIWIHISIEDKCVVSNSLHPFPQLSVGQVGRI